MARPERFELPTPRFVVWCSIQLSYGRIGRQVRKGPTGRPHSYRLCAALARDPRTMEDHGATAISRTLRCAASGGQAIGAWSCRRLPRLRARRRDARKMQPELQPRRIVVHLDACPVQARAGGGEAQAEAVAGRAAAALEAIETLEHMREFMRRDARTVVRDRNRRAVGAARD